MNIYGISHGNFAFLLNKVFRLSACFDSEYTFDSGFVGDLDGKESACNAGDPGSFRGSGRPPGEGNGYPLQYFLPGKLCGQRSLEGYSLWRCNESNTAE